MSKRQKINEDESIVFSSEPSILSQEVEFLRKDLEECLLDRKEVEQKLHQSIHTLTNENDHWKKISSFQTRILYLENLLFFSYFMYQVLF